MRLGTFVVAVGAALAASALPASAEVHVTMSNGQVTISAKNATPSQILAEWARVGHSRIVNGERVTGAPLTIELTNVSEAQALDVILRGVGGYVLAPRADAEPSASRYDRIFIVMATTPVRAAAPVAPTPQPRIVQPMPPPPEPDEIPDQPRAAAPNPFAGRGLGQADSAPPAYNTFPQPAAAPRGVPQSPAGSPAGVPVPGMVTPAPQQQQQQPAIVPGQPTAAGTPQ